jgi:hypothetical protein
MAEAAPQPALEQVGRPLTLIPVGLKEAALDSPTFRATAVHFSDQVEILENWIENWIRSITRLVHDAGGLEATVNNFLQRSLPPSNVSEAVLDHDYTLLSMERLGEGCRNWWSQFITGTKRMETTLAEPLRAFMNTELRNFKDARRYLEQTQKTFDTALNRYLGQSKTKEPSALREDAFQVHGARKAYMKASLDFCLLAPQLRFAIDKLLIKVCTDQWKEMGKSRELGSMHADDWNNEMNRIRSWIKEMDAGEPVFRRELQLARKEIAEAAANSVQPSRELEDYNISTVAFLGTKGPNVLGNLEANKTSEKQGWLYMRIISGKPARTNWVRRWFYVKRGIFGWLLLGPQNGVVESEKIGVLLCNVKPAVGEDRRFCFEVKTKNSTILLQAETQSQLVEWLEAFEIAKNNAIKATTDTDFAASGALDPAFAITSPTIPEFAAKNDGHAISVSEDVVSGGVDRSNTLPIPGFDLNKDVSRSSFDVASPTRRGAREDGESGRDHAARIIQKLDIHRRSTANWQDAPSTPASPGPMTGAIGGIASMISASNSILPLYAPSALKDLGSLKNMPPSGGRIRSSTLAPSTLVNAPSPTNLSKTAVIVGGDRGLGISRSDATGGMPSGLMANLWGSTNWGYINRLGLEEGDNKTTTISAKSPPSLAGSNEERTVGQEDATPTGNATKDVVPKVSITPNTPPPFQHRKAVSVDAQAGQVASAVKLAKEDEYPANYPLELKTQEAQFRMLFSNVAKEDKVLMVFRATWNPNDQQEFSGRIYVTAKDLFFYSHSMGLVLISSVSLDTIQEVTAAPGKGCDYLFLHLKDEAIKADFTRITIKTFLEPIRLLQMRLNYIVEMRRQGETQTLEQVMARLIQMEKSIPVDDSSNDSWDDVSADPHGEEGHSTLAKRKERDLKRAIHVERGVHLHGTDKHSKKFMLPSAPVIYQPPDMNGAAVERQFDISPKGLYHVMFGDKSVVFQLLYHERRAQRIAQGPWIHLDGGHMQRDFSFQIDYVDMFRRHRQANVADYQVIDIINDHVCYVITDKKTPCKSQLISPAPTTSP